MLICKARFDAYLIDVNVSVEQKNLNDKYAYNCTYKSAARLL